MSTDTAVNSATGAAASSAAASAASGATVTSAASTNSTATNQLSGNMSEFLQLLTTQLQNQDPMNPMDSTAFTQQLVEYSQVEQQINTNSDLTTLNGIALNQSLSLALGYVGKQITYDSSDMNFDGTNPVTINYNLPTTSASNIANIYDSSGSLVDTQALPNTAGTNNFTWNGTLTDGGTAPAGTYSVGIQATDTTGNAETVDTAVTGAVTGVESQDGVPYLIVGQRSVPLGSVIDTSTVGTNTSTIAPTTTSTSSGSGSNSNSNS